VWISEVAGMWIFDEEQSLMLENVLVRTSWKTLTNTMEVKTDSIWTDKKYGPVSYLGSSFDLCVAEVQISLALCSRDHVKM
jgi:hypothetical protein